MNKSILFVSLFIMSAHSWSLRVVNYVDPCPGRNYPTLKLFISAWDQRGMWKGQDAWIDGSSLPWTGLGIQENGMYCRSNGNEGGCINPDNAGLQLVIGDGNCYNMRMNDPFYCGAHPPNAKHVIDIGMSGQWPNCVATVWRRGDAPQCNTWC